MRISDWSSDVCSSDLAAAVGDGDETSPAFIVGKCHILPLHFPKTLQPSPRHCERSEAIQGGHRTLWVAASPSAPRNDESYNGNDGFPSTLFSKRSKGLSCPQQTDAARHQCFGTGDERQDTETGRGSWRERG